MFSITETFLVWKQKLLMLFCVSIFLIKVFKEESGSKAGKKSLKKITVTTNIHQNGCKFACLVLNTQSTICVNFNPLY